VGGIERQVEALARHQLEAGHRVRVVTAIPDPDRLVDDELLPIVRPDHSRVFISGSPVHLRHLARRALRGPGVDVIHAHLSLASPLAVHTARYASRHGIPLALTVHSMWPDSVITTRSANLPYWWGPIHGAWSAVSTAATENVRPVIGRHTPIMVVPNIVETRWWHPTGTLRPTDPSEIRIITVGRLARRKRVEPFVEILRQVRDRLDPAVRLRVSIIGEGSRRPHVTQLLTEYGMADWVHLLGQQEPSTIRDALQDSDLFVAPARRESFGIAALEARAAGLPVIGLRRNGLSDFIADGREGVLCEDDSAMVDALVDLAVDPARLTAMRAHTNINLPTLDAKDALRAVDELYERAFASIKFG
jgi:glycosyltransferase involved in cell wall biosynthesis